MQLHTHGFSVMTLLQMAVAIPAFSVRVGRNSRKGLGLVCISTSRRLFAIALLIALTTDVVHVSSSAIQELSSVDKVQRWLVELGVDEAVRANFVEQEVDVEALVLCTGEQLSKLGVSKLGKQLKLMAKAKQEQEVQRRHGVASIRTNTYGDSTNKGGIQFCTKDEGSAEVGVKAVLSAEGRFGIGVEGEPEAKLHVKGDAIFDAGHCDRIHAQDIHAQYINASSDVMVQDQSVRKTFEKLEEKVGVVNSSLTRQFMQRLATEIATKDSQINSLSAALDEHVANLTLSLKEVRSDMAKKDEQIANLTAEVRDSKHT